MQIRKGLLLGVAALLVPFSGQCQTSTAFQAKDDRFLLGRDGRSVVPVLDNDTGDRIRIEDVGKPRYGTAVVRKTDGKEGSERMLIIYTAGPDFSGFDSFRYTISNLARETSTATVAIFSPSVAAAGLYGANVFDREGKLAGHLELRVSKTGAFTGELEIGNEDHRLAGFLNAGGRYVGFAKGEDGKALPVILEALSDESGNMKLKGTIGKDGQWTILRDIGDLTADVLDSLEGRYTVELPPPGGASSDGTTEESGDDRDLPQGSGWMTIKIDDKGEARIEGKTGDGRSFSTSAQVASEDGKPVLPFYISWGKSLLGGTLTLAEKVTGEIAWYRGKSSEERYPDGFETTVSASGERYHKPKKGQRALFNESSDGGRATLTVSGGGTEEFTRELKISEDDDVTTLDQDPEKNIDLEINRKRGTFTGKFRDPDHLETRVDFSGVLLQSEGRGVGFFTAETKTGKIELQIESSSDDGDNDSDDDGNTDDGGDGDVGSVGVGVDAGGNTGTGMVDLLF